MNYQMVILVPVLLPTLVFKATCDNNTDSNVIVKYYGHAEANYPSESVIIEPPVDTTAVTELASVTTSTPTQIPYTTTTTFSTPKQSEETEGIVFIPNNAPVVRIEDQYDRGEVKLQDILDRKTPEDIMAGHLRIETEAPLNEVVFVPGSNNDYTEKKEIDIKQKNSRRNHPRKEEKKIIKRKPKLDCSNLDCNNTIKSICGGKIINRKMQYRLFLNECYLRKVNCNFKHEMNRYSELPADNCRKAGRQESPFSFKRKNLDSPKKTENLNLKMSYSSRRSMSMNMNGKFCSHPCPVSCSDDYEPECALSATGQRKVFMNHCKLDDNSCLFGVVWHRRPLSECVGGKKADMRQNRHFISWMQRMGIVDNKGKLVLE